MKSGRNWKAIFILTILMVLAAAVHTHAASAAISKKSLTLSVGKSVTLKVTGTKKTVTWKSSKTSVAAVSAKGVVKGKKAGTAKITAKADGRSFTCSVKVAGKTASGSAAAGKETAKLTASVAGMSAQEAKIYKAMYARKKALPEGAKWTNENYYAWNGGVYSGGYGCAGFAFILSDAAFGNRPARIHRDPSQVRVGDVLRTDNNSHCVIVMKVCSGYIVVAEGNYGGRVHWGRVITNQELKSTMNFALTRY